MMKTVIASAIVAAAAGLVSANQHGITFTSNCPSTYIQLPGIGTWQNTQWSSAQIFNQQVAGGIISGGQNCSPDGNNCISVEFSLMDNGYSSGDITLISPHAWPNPGSNTWFSMYPSGAGNSCDGPGCSGAFHSPDQTWVQKGDSDPNAGITVYIGC